MTAKVPVVQLYDKIRCEPIDDKTEKSGNLLKLIDIEDDLRLSILLNLTPRTGITKLIDHSRPDDKYTRFLYIFYADREQRLPDDPVETRRYVPSSLRDPEATHVITAISFGIDVFIVLQLPDKNNTTRKIDVALRKIRDHLENSTDAPSFTIDDEQALKKIDEIKVYSNVFELTEMTSLLEICQYINGLKKKSEMYRPLIYTLRSIEWWYSDADKSGASSIPPKKSNSGELEKRFLENLNQMKKIKYSLDSSASKWSPDHSKEPLLQAQNEWQNLREIYEKEIDRIRNLVLAERNNQETIPEIDEALKHVDQITLRENIRKLMKQVTDLETFTCSGNNPPQQQQQQQFEHCEALESDVNQNHNEQTLKRKLTTENQQNRTVDSNDASTNNNGSALSIEKENASSPSIETQISVIATSSSENEIINVLLLGESGVGKSTFINAFVNYLTFKTLNQAESRRPVVLIPVSFLITTGDHFEEHIIKFGDTDNFNNEDFDHPGQSVTQQCKSYLFKLNHCDGRKMRIIDTPGFGDTRGIDQDDLNMKHILEYINNLTHLNAVCFLLKPNLSRIHNFFQNCLSQILDVLGSNFCQNIVFCFTNSRSTFYTPGDTAPLLKGILKSPSTDRIPFDKENTFCFDNESFRYLVALQKSIAFDKQDREEYENSWSKSVRESERLLHYVCTQLLTDAKPAKWQSIRNAEFQITHMVRPMLESMRNILRNKIMYETDSRSKSIELIPKALSRPAAVCFTCERDYILKGNFWIVSNVPHEIQKQCYSCDCDTGQHMAIHYKLEYEYLNKPSRYDLNEMKKSLSQLRHTSVEFAHFLIYIASSSQSDPFMTGMTQMIDEENDIYRSKDSYTNYKLAEDLRKLLRRYTQEVDSMDPNQQRNKLPAIYKSIQTVCEHPLMQVQMVAIKKTKENIMKLYEYVVPENPANTSVR